MKRLFLFLTIVVFSGQLVAQNIIPVPVQMEQTKGSFVFDVPVDIVIPANQPEVKTYAENFGAFLSKSIKAIKVTNKKTAKKAIVIILATDEKQDDEGYKLNVTDREIKITASTHKGIFNGLQTLRQLLPAETEAPNGYSGKVVVQGVAITDFPRYKWRGLMLDVSRHFFTVDEVKQYIDKMSQFKFNVFHWHLTDDEGWRIEIKSLPRLTEIGAWRVERNGAFGDSLPYPKQGEKATYGGFYTQEQIKDVIKYAADRNITIVPEIDMPGHSMALLAAYPELSTKKEPKFVSPGSTFAEWYGNGTFKMLIENMLNPADEKVYEAVDKIFTEVAQLFPGEYIHMGGDECYHGYWDASPSVQAFMWQNKIKDTHELQAYFVRRVNDIIASKGKKMIGWDEILDGGGLPKNTAVMSWRGMEGGIKAAKAGHHVVMSPTTFAYLDYTQGDKSVENPIYADLSLQKSYELEPTPDGVDPKYIMGGQANLWTEAVSTMQFAFYMAYPRVLAVSEKLWSPKGASNFNGFLNRLENTFTRFDEARTSISKAIYEPAVNIKKDDEKYVVTLNTAIPGADIYYSTDNTYPVKYAKKYTGPIVLPDGLYRFRTQTIKDGKELGRELIIPIADLKKRAK